MAARLHAARRLRKRIDDDPDLDPQLSIELQRRIETHLQQLRERGEELVPPAALDALEALEPPPLPLPAATAEPREIPIAQEPPRAAITPPLPAEPREPTLWSRLGSAFAENILFALAGFLILGGAIFFGTTAWTTMTGAARLGVVFGGLMLLAGALQGAGRLLNRRQNLPEVERVLGNVAAFIAPLACIVAGEATIESPPLGLTLAALGLAGSWWFSRRATTLLHAPLGSALTRGMPLLGAAGIASAWAASMPLSMALATAVLLLVAARPLARRIAPPTRSWWVALSMLGFAALACGAGLALRYQAPIPLRLAPLGLLLSATGLSMAWVEWSYGRRSHPTNARSGVVLILAIGLALTGAAIATADPRAMLFSVAASCLATLAAAFRFDRTLLIWPGLALSVVTYFLLPAPVRELALELRSLVAGELGYEPQRLPISFYGVTFLPYLALCGVAVKLLERRGHPRFAGAVIAWTLSVATGLAALSIFAGQDERAPMIVLPSLAAMLVALGAVTRRQKLVFAGGVGFAASTLPLMLHLELGATASIELLGGCGVALYLVAALLHCRCPAEAFRRRAGLAFCDSSALTALATLLWLGAHWGQSWQLIDARLLPAQLGMALWLAALARSYGLPLLKPLAWGSAGLGLCATLGPAALIDPRASIWLAAAAALPLAAGRIRLALPLPQRPNPAAGLPADAPTTAIAVLTVQSIALLAVGLSLARQPQSIELCIAMSIAASTCFAAALLRGRAWLATIGACELIAAALLFSIARDHGLTSFMTVASVATSLLLIAGLAAGAQRIGKLAALGPVGLVADIGLPLVLLWWLIPALPVGLLPPWAEAATVLYIGLAIAAAALLRALHQSARGLQISSGAVFALSSLLIVAAGCDLAGGRDAAFATAFGGTAVLLALFARRQAAPLIALHAGVAILIPIVRLGMELPGDAWTLSALIAAAAACHRGLRSLPTPGTVMLWIALSAAGWAGLTWIDAEVDLWWLPLLLLGTATLAQLSSRIPAAGLDRSGNSMFVASIAILAALLGSAHALNCVVLGVAPHVPTAPAVVIDLLALGLVLLSAAIASDRHWRRYLALPGVLLLTAPFLAPLCERLLVDGGGLPVIEYALIALAAAALRARWIGFSLTAATLLLTRFDFGPVTAPIAVTSAAFVPLLSALRERRAADLGLHADALLVACAVWVLHLDQGAEWASLPWIAGCAAALAAIEAITATRIGDSTDISTALRRASSRALISTIALAALATFGTWADPYWNFEGPDNALIAGSLIVAAVLALRAAWRGPSALHAHLAVAALVTLFAQVSVHTGLLDWLGDHRLSLLTLAAIGMLIARHRAPQPVKRALCIDAMLLPIPAVLALGTEASIAGSTALALAAAPYAIAARQLGWSFGGWIAAALLNAAVWSLWRYAGVVDPALYGLPLGLSLVLGSEIARNPVTRALTRSTGLVVLYGSIAVQVLRVEDPGHAVLLFVLGLATVGLGFWKRRNDYLLAGAATVVVDVIAYLVQHGLAKDFVGAGLLVGAGLTLLAAGVARRRIQARRAPPPDARPSDDRPAGS